MTVDIDISGTRSDYLEDEDIVPVEDYEEVEAVEVMEEEPERPQRMPPAAVKKPNPWVKRILVLVVVIVLILVALWAFVYFGTRITDIQVGLSEDQSNYPDIIKVTALVGTSGSASIAGKGDLEVKYDEDLVYSSKININDAGTGVVDVPYNSFIEGNGNYYFQVKYEGKESPPALYEVRYIVESLNITAFVGTVGNSGQLNLSFFMQDKDEKNIGATPKGVELTLDKIINTDSNNEIPTDDTTYQIDDSYIKYDPDLEPDHPDYFPPYPYDESGNYTFTATITNTRAKSSSDYYEITQNTDWYLNIQPIAKAVVTDTQATGLTYTATFDASASWNDGEKTLYIWDFDNNNEVDLETENPIATWSNYAITRDYTAKLTVEGDEYIIIPETEDEIEFGITFVDVEAP